MSDVYDTTEARIDVLLGVAGMYRPSDDEACGAADVTNATAGWRAVAADVGLDAAGIDRMARAFKHDEAEPARELIVALAGRS